MNWQPIETAPKDGRPLLMWLAEPIDRHYEVPGLSSNTAIGFWCEGNWVSIECEDNGFCGSSATGWMTSWEWIKIDPTHWTEMEPPK